MLPLSHYGRSMKAMAVDANTTSFIEQMSAVTTGVMPIITNTLTLFTTAPINYFVGLGVAVMGIKVVKKLVPSKRS